VLTGFPVASVLVGSRVRDGHRALFGIAVLELVWTVVAQCVVGFTIALRSG
jgi:hypothetical protein